MNFLKRCMHLLIPVLLILVFAEWQLESSRWTKLRAIQKLKTKQINAYPGLSILNYLEDAPPTKKTEGNSLIPLAGVANAFTVVCKEQQELTYKADQYGFNNPKRRWKNESTDLAFIGDSYIQGFCVRPQDHFISQLEQSMSLINLGIFGSGPLSELGILEEYGKILRPRVVIWSYMSNDLVEDLDREKNNLELVKYLNSQTQDLANKQLSINEHQITLMKEKETHLLKNILPSLNWRFYNLRMQIRNLILLTFRGTLPQEDALVDFNQPEKINWVLFEEILVKARETVESWNGRFVFLYLPESNHWNPKSFQKITLFKKDLFLLLQRLEIPILDFSPTLEKSSNPLSKYSVFDGQYGHYNEEGQSLLSQFLLTELKSINPISLKKTSL